MGDRSRIVAVALIVLVAVLFIATAARDALVGGVFLVAAIFLIYIAPHLVGVLAQIAKGDEPLPSWIAILLGAAVALIASLVWTPLIAFTNSRVLDTAISMFVFASASEVGAWLVRTVRFMRRGRNSSAAEGVEAKA